MTALFVLPEIHWGSQPAQIAVNASIIQTLFFLAIAGDQDPRDEDESPVPPLGTLAKEGHSRPLALIKAKKLLLLSSNEFFMILGGCL
jgi:hypothetical protein